MKKSKYIFFEIVCKITAIFKHTSFILIKQLHNIKHLNNNDTYVLGKYDPC